MCAYLKMCSLLQICVQYCIDVAYVVEIKLNSIQFKIAGKLNMELYMIAC